MIVHNPTDTPVRDYPIQDPKSGEVALWSINPGETLDFPDYEGQYLLGIYGFLQRIITPEQQAREKAEEAKLTKGQHFSQVKIIGDKGFTNENMQPPAPTQEELQPKNATVTPPTQQPTNNPPPNPEMTGAMAGDATEQISEVREAKPTSAPAPEAKPSMSKKDGKINCTECESQFSNKQSFKIHYAHKHLKIPGID